jgi:hypothetical protein
MGLSLASGARTTVLISVNSYVEHFGRERYEGGLHCPAISSRDQLIRDDLNRDRALNPTNYLKKNRPEVIELLL